MIDLTMILSVARLLRVTGLRSVRTASTATTNRKNLREEKQLFDDIGQCHDEASPYVPSLLLSALGSIHVIVMYACCVATSVVDPDCLRAGYI